MVFNSLSRVLVSLSSFCVVLHTGAVHRYYESRRRLFNDDKLSRIEKAKETKLKSKKKSYRKTVCIPSQF